MSRRLLVAGGPGRRREALVAALDAAFDLDVVVADGPLDAMRRLPNSDFGLVLVLPSAGGEAPPLDLVRFLAGHARHGRTPVALLDGGEAERAAARALGARALDPPSRDEDVRALVQDLLGLG